MSKTIRPLLLFVVLLCLIHNVDSCLRRTKIVYKDVCRTPEPLTQLNSTSETGGPSSDGVTKPSTKGGVVPDAITTKATVPSTTTTPATTTSTTTASTTTTTTPTTTTTSNTPKKPTTKDPGDIEVGQCIMVPGKVPITNAADCKEPWKFVGNGCFQFIIGTDQNGRDAKEEKLPLTDKCEAAGGMFSAPRSESVMQNVLKALNGVPNAKMMWLGIQNATHDTFERYMDGSRLNYTKWAPFQPYTRFDGDQCVVLNRQKKAWEAVPCASKQNALLCEKKKDGEVCEPLKKECVFSFDDSKKQCEKGWTPYPESGKCYKIIGVKRKYHQHLKAATDMQATLASIHSNGQMQFLRDMYEKFDENSEKRNKVRPFIGLVRDTSDFSYGTYQDGSTIDYVYFEKHTIAEEPTLRRQTCVVFEQHPAYLSLYSTEDCENKNAAIYSMNAKGRWLDQECEGHIVVRNFKNGERVTHPYP